MDLRHKLYRWSSAGHDAPMIYDPMTKQFEEPDGGSLPLGVMDDTQYEEQTFGPLKPRQILVIGTDGVWEMPNSGGEQFGKDRLRAVIQSAADGSAEQIAQAIRAALTAYRGEEKSVDDVTFVILKAVE
jgi:sigma-B regulation protein RsbU (phosphoserine phosphatase)